MKIGMTGSKLFTGKHKIKELMWMIKQKQDEDIEIVSLGEDYGADLFVRKYAFKFDLKYGEFIPYHKKWNSSCLEQAYLFGKPYSGKYYFMCYNNFVKYCDKIIFFSYDEKIHPVIKIANKKNKEIIIVT